MSFTGERLFVVIYDIADAKRWRSVFRTMHGYGEWLQLSAFQCRLSARRHAELIADLDQIIHHGADHVIMMDLGNSETPNVISLGKRQFEPVATHPVIV